MKNFDTEFKESIYPPEVEIEYSVSLEDDMAAFDAYQRLFERSKLILWTVLIIIGIAVNAYSFAAGGANTMHILLIVLLLFIAGTIWTRPARVKKGIINASKEIEDGRYRMELYKDYLKITTVYSNEQLEEIRRTDPEYSDEDIPATLIHLTNNAVRIAELENILAVCIKQKNAYALPKKAFSSEEYARAVEILKKALDERFR